VVSPVSLKKERVAIRDPQRPASQIDSIMENQWSDEKKMALADAIIYNDETHSLIKQANQLNSRILQMVVK
jgi:dephospho-CoA kinase